MSEPTLPEIPPPSRSDGVSEDQELSEGSASSRSYRSVKRTDAAHRHAGGRRRSARKSSQSYATNNPYSLSESGGFWTRPWRRLKSAWNYWNPEQVLKKGVGGGGKLINQALLVDNAKVGQEPELNVAREWPSRKTMLNPLWWVSCTLAFGVQWLVTRRWIALLSAAPGIVVAFCCVAAISAGDLVAPSVLSSVYKRMLSGTVISEAREQQRFALDALLQLEPGSVTAIYHRALIDAQSGNVAGARAVMQELAVNAQSLDAALWLAQKIGNLDELRSWSKEQLVELHGWLQQAVQNAPEERAPRRMLADLLVFVGNKRGAYEVLLPIADNDTDTSFLFYFLQQNLGLTDLAESRGERLERSLRQRLKEQPNDLSAAAQIGLLLASMQRFDEARHFVDEALQYANEPASQLRLQRAYSDIYVAEARYMKATDTSTAGLRSRLKVLQRAVELDNGNPNIRELLAEVCFEATDSDDEQAHALRDAIVANVSSDEAHFILGTMALRQGNFKDATLHLEIAAQNMPRLPGLLNNLAYALCFGDNPDLERALQFANSAIALQGNHTYLHETRGQIYLKLKRYTEAIADLEVALNAPELRQQVRQALAEAYEALGQQEIAQSHRQRASGGE